MKQKEFLIIIISIFFLTLLWVVFNIYHNRITSTIKDPLTYQIIPIQGSFDKKAIERIKERNRVNPFFEIINEPTTLPSPTPSIDIQTENDSSSSAIDQNLEPDITTEDSENSIDL